MAMPSGTICLTAGDKKQSTDPLTALSTEPQLPPGWEGPAGGDLSGEM